MTQSCWDRATKLTAWVTLKRRPGAMVLSLFRSEWRIVNGEWRARASPTGAVTFESKRRRLRAVGAGRRCSATQEAPFQAEHFLPEESGLLEECVEGLGGQEAKVRAQDQLGLELRSTSVGLAQEWNELRREMAAPAFRDVGGTRDRRSMELGDQAKFLAIRKLTRQFVEVAD